MECGSAGHCLANLLGGLVAYEIGQIHGDVGSWWYLFLVLEGHGASGLEWLSNIS